MNHISGAKSDAKVLHHPSSNSHKTDKNYHLAGTDPLRFRRKSGSPNR